MPRQYGLRKRVMVTGGAGFLGSHLCERLLADGYDVLCVDNFYTGTQATTSRICVGRPALRAAAPRRHVPAVRRGRRDLQPRLPRLADPLPVRPGPDDQDQRPRRDQHARARASACSARILQASTSEVYGDPEVHPQREDYWGNVNPIGIRACYDEGKRCAETLFFDYHRQHGVEIKVARIFNTYGPRMHPNDGRVVSNFIVQALHGRADHRLRRRAADALVLLRRRPDRRARPADGLRAPSSPGRSTSATRSSSRCSSLPAR